MTMVYMGSVVGSRGPALGKANEREYQVRVESPGGGLVTLPYCRIKNAWWMGWDTVPLPNGTPAMAWLAGGYWHVVLFGPADPLAPCDTDPAGRPLSIMPPRTAGGLLGLPPGGGSGGTGTIGPGTDPGGGFGEF